MPINHKLFYEHGLAALNNTSTLEGFSEILSFYLDRVTCLSAQERDHVINDFLSYATHTGLMLVTPIDLVQGRFSVDQDIYQYLLEETFGGQHGNAY
jgi:hypothetical protein